MISLSIAGVIILVDTGSTLSILYASTLEWMGNLSHFLQTYSNMVLKIKVP